MTLLLLFAGVLLVAVLVSDLADRSILSTAVLFLVAGFLAGDGMLGWVEVSAQSESVRRLVEVALFAVLFTDGMRLRLHELSSAWAEPARALLLGTPLMFLGVAGAALALTDVSWREALLIGAVLAPTDPVLASALLGREEVSPRLRRLLNVESGLNDGLALPIVLATLALVDRQALEPERLAGEVGLGVALGVVVPAVVVWLERRPLFAARALYRPLLASSVALLLYSAARVLGGNEFLAAFAGGVTLASMSEGPREEFRRFGALLTEHLKLASLLVFGALIRPSYFTEIGVLGCVFIVVVLLVVRPAALELVLVGSGLSWRQRAVVGWFGPKGFASMLFGLLILGRSVERGQHLFHLAALVIAASIVAHSSTDVLVARWLERVADQEPSESRAEQGSGPSSDPDAHGGRPSTD